MPAKISLAEDTVARMAPDAQALQSGRDLVRKKSFRDFGVSADGTWLLGKCQGSGKEPYQVSCDLTEPSAPVGRCTCPSRKFPCKHALGLMLAYVQSPDSFKECEPPADLTAKREKQQQRKEKKAEDKKEPRKVNEAALKKKAASQKEGLDLLEKLLVDLVGAGQWFEPKRLERIDSQAKQLADAYLPGAMFNLRRLVQLGQLEGLPDDGRDSIAADYLAKLWATVQRGRDYLDDKIAGDETQSEVDAVIEEVLGKVWQLAELREKGYCKADLLLLELAYERSDDPARQERVETSHLLDLKDGGLYQAITYRPFKGLKFVAEQPSYTQPLLVQEAAVYPGFPGMRRARWEKSAERVEELKPEHRRKAYDLAQPSFEAVLAAYRKQLKNPLAPDVTHAWLRCKKVWRQGDFPVIEDAQGARLRIADNVLEGKSTRINLLRAAGFLAEPAVLLRLDVQVADNTLYGQALAALTPDHHLRLGV